MQRSGILQAAPHALVQIVDLTLTRIRHACKGVACLRHLISTDAPAFPVLVSLPLWLVRVVNRGGVVSAASEI